MTGTEIGFLIADFCSLIPVLVGCYFFKRLHAHRRILLYLFIYNAIVELTNAWMAMHDMATWMYNVFMLFEFGVFAYVLGKWANMRFITWLTIAGAGLFYILWGIFYYSHNIKESNAAAEFTESIILLLLSVYVVTSLSLTTEQPVLKNYRFWFSGTLFIYFTANILFSYLFEKIFSIGPGLSPDLWTVHTVIQIAVYLLYAYAFYLPEV
jgi:hypothetical protein